MWRLWSQSSPSWTEAYASLICAEPARSDLTSVPVRTIPVSRRSSSSKRNDACRFVAMSPGWALRFLPFAIGPPIVDAPGVPDPAALADRLRALHVPGDPLLLLNAWDAASARVVAEAGVPAVATTSSGLTRALGFDDEEQ